MSPLHDPMMNRDDLYSMPLSKVGDFTFDEQVVRVFPDMIARSVPGYGSILSMIELLAERFVKPGSQVWDLGCSLGAATRLIRRQAPRNCRLHAVDSSPAMIARLREMLDEEADSGCRVELHEADLRSVAVQEASFVVLNLTLQFVPQSDRDAVIRSVFEGLQTGGALLISEKVCFDNKRQQLLLTELHHDFKRSHGYSNLEVAQKRTAIENMLIPETVAEHVARLTAAGFATVAPWFQCFNFVSILAVK